MYIQEHDGFSGHDSVLQVAGATTSSICCQRWRVISDVTVNRHLWPTKY